MKYILIFLLIISAFTVQGAEELLDQVGFMIKLKINKHDEDLMVALVDKLSGKSIPRNLYYDGQFDKGEDERNVTYFWKWQLSKGGDITKEYDKTKALLDDPDAFVLIFSKNPKGKIQKEGWSPKEKELVAE